MKKAEAKQFILEMCGGDNPHIHPVGNKYKVTSFENWHPYGGGNNFESEVIELLVAKGHGKGEERPPYDIHSNYLTVVSFRSDYNRLWKKEDIKEVFMNTGNKPGWVAPSPEQISEIVQYLGGRTKVGRLLRLPEKAVKAGTTVGNWVTGKAKISPATWAILQAKIDGIELDKYFEVK